MSMTTFSCPAFLVLLAGIASAQSSSPSFRLTPTTVNGGGGTSVSPAGTAFRLSASFGQESTIGASSSTRFVVQSGFWSFMGTGLVPVVLSGVKNGTSPSDPDFDWTGNSGFYLVYRDTNCADVYGTGPLFSQGGNFWTDTAPPAASLVCYSVLGSAPGPIAPPGGPEAPSFVVLPTSRK